MLQHQNYRNDLKSTCLVFQHKMLKCLKMGLFASHHFAMLCVGKNAFFTDTKCLCFFPLISASPHWNSGISFQYYIHTSDRFNEAKKNSPNSSWRSSFPPDSIQTPITLEIPHPRRSPASFPSLLTLRKAS